MKEPLLDAVTGLSGSGPAYVFLVAEALIEAGVLAGLPRDVSETLSVQTLLGAATLLATSDDGAEALRAAVTSPGGTTAAGLRVLEQHGLRSALLEAVSRPPPPAAGSSAKPLDNSHNAPSSNSSHRNVRFRHTFGEGCLPWQRHHRALGCSRRTRSPSSFGSRP